MVCQAWGDILTTFEFADKIKSKNFGLSLFSIATTPGTEMYKMQKYESYSRRLPEDFYGFGKGVINTDEWSAIELD